MSRSSASRAVVAALLLAWIIAIGATTTSVATAAGGNAVVTVGVAGRTNEYSSLASDGSFVALTWSASKEGSGTDIYAAVSRDAGASFSAPVRVNSTAGQAQVNGEQPPRILIVKRTAGLREVVVVWTAKVDAGTRLLSARSTDDGRSFATATTLAGSEAAGNRGWESIAADASGRIVVIWLDHRDTMAAGMTHDHAASSPAAPAVANGRAAPQPGAAAHDHAAAAPAAASDPTTKAQLSQLYAASLDGGPATSITRGVCYCCKTSIVFDQGVMYAVWRHVYAGSRRDIAMTTSRDGGRTFAAPARVSEDNWQLDGCPENGPTLAVDRQHRVHVVWPRVAQEGGRSSLKLFHAVTSDGRVFSARDALPTSGAAYHPQLMTAADGSLIVVWDEVIAGTRQVRLARGRIDAAGAVRFEPQPLPGPDRSGLYPSLAITPTHSVIAFTSRGAWSTIAVQRLAN